MLQGNGDGTFQTQKVLTSGIGASPNITAGDFNGDGILDIGAAGGAGGFWWTTVQLGNGDDTFRSSPVPVPNYRAVPKPNHGYRSEQRRRPRFGNCRQPWFHRSAVVRQWRRHHDGWTQLSCHSNNSIRHRRRGLQWRRARRSRGCQRAGKCIDSAGECLYIGLGNHSKCDSDCRRQTNPRAPVQLCRRCELCGQRVKPDHRDHCPGHPDRGCRFRLNPLWARCPTAGRLRRIHTLRGPHRRRDHPGGLGPFADGELQSGFTPNAVLHRDLSDRHTIGWFTHNPCHRRFRCKLQSPIPGQASSQ